MGGMKYFFLKRQQKPGENGNITHHIKVSGAWRNWPSGGLLGGAVSSFFFLMAYLIIPCTWAQSSSSLIKVEQLPAGEFPVVEKNASRFIYVPSGLSFASKSRLGPLRQEKILAYTVSCLVGGADQTWEPFWQFLAAIFPEKNLPSAFLASAEVRLWNHYIRQLWT
jgi:hypothetical protein